MAIQEFPPTGQGVEQPKKPHGLTRRRFLQGLGILGAGAALTIAGVEIPQLIGSSEEKPNNGNPLEHPNGNDNAPGSFLFSAEKLPGEVDEIVLPDAMPSQMVIRRGASINAVGVIVDDAGRKVVCEVEDPLRKTQDGSNETFTCILTDTVVEDQRKPGEVVFSDIIASNGGAYSAENESILSNGKTKALTKLSVEEADDYKRQSGVFFVDRDPLKHEHPLLEVPVVPAPDIDGEIHQADDKRVLIKDANGQDVARARYFPWRKEWRWVKDPESVSDYTIREFADAKGQVFGVFDGDLSADTSRLLDETFTDLYEKVGNQLIIGGALDAKWVFNSFSNSDWRRVLDNWSAIQRSLQEGQIPANFKFNWAKPDMMMDFAEDSGMKVRAQHIIGGADLPDNIKNGNYSNDELEKILEFMAKTRVLKYKGRIEQWDVPDEAAGRLVGGDEDNKFYYSKLGAGIIDKLVGWVKEADPDVTTVMVEDHVVEGTCMPNAINFFRQTSDKFWELLDHFKSAGVPVDKIGLENNLWIYRAPTKDQISSVLKRIQDMGFGLASTETTIISSPTEGFYRELTTNNPASNPDKLQAKVFADLVSAYIEAGGEYALGGLTDATVWTAYKSPQGKSAIFDKDKKPKQAFFAIRDTLKHSLVA